MKGKTLKFFGLIISALAAPVMFAIPVQPALAATPLTGRIAFVSDRDGNQQIYIMNADGSNQTRLTNNTATDANPKLSSDGKKIAFNSDRDGNQEIYVMNADGSNQMRLTNNTLNDVQPAWSPDGTKIAFSSVRSGIPQIWMMNADGSDTVQLTFGDDDPNDDAYTDPLPSGAEQPAFSADGTRIAFQGMALDGITVYTQ